MILDARFDNVVIYNVQDRLDVKQGEKFELSWTEAPDGTDIFTNEDEVLRVVDTTVEATAPGTSKVRFMTDTTVKELLIVVFEKIIPPAVKLETSFGKPETK